MGQSVMLFYLMALSFKIFGISLFSVRLPMLIVSILAMMAFYDLTKKIFKKEKIALLALAFIAINPWHFMQSIWAIDCNMFPHFMLFAVYFLYRGIKEKKIWLYLSMLFFGLSMYTYGVSVYIVPLFLLISAIYLKKQKLVDLKTIFICIGIYFLVSAPIFLMYVLNAFKINTNLHLGPITIQYFVDSTRTNDMIFFSQNIGQTFLSNIQSLVKTFFFQYDGFEWNATKYFGTIYHLSLLFFFVGIINYFKNIKVNHGLFLMTLWFMLSLILGIIINNININRLNIIWYPTLFFSVYGIYIFVNYFKNNKILKGSLIVIYMLLFISFVIYFYSSYNNLIASSGCFGRKMPQAIHYSNVDLNKETIIFSPSYEIYPEFQDILDQTKTEQINNYDIFMNRFNNKKENEAFIISKYDIRNTNINDYQYTLIGDYYIIY